MASISSRLIPRTSSNNFLFRGAPAFSLLACLVATVLPACRANHYVYTSYGTATQPEPTRRGPVRITSGFTDPNMNGLLRAALERHGFTVSPDPPAGALDCYAETSIAFAIVSRIRLFDRGRALIDVSQSNHGDGTIIRRKQSELSVTYLAIQQFELELMRKIP